MTSSLRTRMRSSWIVCSMLAGCGITIPGNLDLGIDDPGVIGAAGRGGSGPVTVAGTWGGGASGTGVAGRRGGVSGTGVAGTWGGSGTGVAGTWGGSGTGAAGIWGGYAGTGVAGTWGGYAGTGGVIPADRDGDGWDEYKDCNDYNTSIHPGAMDACCDGIDSDCDGLDSPAGAACRCAPPPSPADVDHDGDGWTINQGDCDDRDPSSFPGAYEQCFDGRDQNCDGLSDFEDWNCRTTLDNDGDGYDQTQDCNDNDYWIRPGVGETCGDGIDNDCDGVVDPYPYCGGQPIDWDRDGYPSEKDCNDGDATVFPGSPYEKCCDAIDSNCDGWDGIANSICTCPTPGDGDGDGYGIGMSDPTLADCNDQDATIHPNALEICDDKRDNDCDGLVDGADNDCWKYVD